VSDRIDTQVLIVGGGPVGTTLAIDLAQRGIEVTIAETRAGGEPPNVRCNHVAARTMEIVTERASADKSVCGEWFKWLLEIPPQTMGTSNKAYCEPPI